MKQLILAGLLILGAAAVSRAATTRYVQISTATLTRQSGTAMVAGVNASTTTISSATITAATISTLRFAGGSSQTFAGRIIGGASFTTTASSGTTATTYIPTGISLSYTPLSNASTIYISLSGEYVVNGPATNTCYLTIFKDSTDLGNSPDGMVQVTSPNATANNAHEVTIANFPNFPNTLSTVTYQIYIKAQGSTTCTWNVSNVRAHMTVMEFL